ncbi:hypothetical protein ACFQVB_42135 [Paraburkholderia humisilvae]
MIHIIIVNVGWFAFAAFYAMKVVRWISPYLCGRRNEMPDAAQIEHIVRESEKYRGKQICLNMTMRDALKVHAVNAVVSIALLCIVGYLVMRAEPSISTAVILAFGAYLAGGYVVCLLVDVVSVDALTGLDWRSRVTLRIYHVWLWPFNVASAMRRKH